MGTSIRPTAEEIKSGRAIPCHLNLDDDSDCYFGHGVYADGICDEVRKSNEEMNQLKQYLKEFGVIVPSKKKIFMKDSSDRVSVCGFHRFLVYL